MGDMGEDEIQESHKPSCFGHSFDPVLPTHQVASVHSPWGWASPITFWKTQLYVEGSIPGQTYRVYKKSEFKILLKHSCHLLTPTLGWGDRAGTSMSTEKSVMWEPEGANHHAMWSVGPLEEVSAVAMPLGVGTKVLFVFISGCGSMAAADARLTMVKRLERMPAFMLIKV